MNYLHGIEYWQHGPEYSERPTEYRTHYFLGRNPSGQYAKCILQLDIYYGDCDDFDYDVSWLDPSTQEYIAFDRLDGDCLLSECCIDEKKIARELL